MLQTKYQIKKLRLRLNRRADDGSPFKSAKLTNENNILKISNNPNTLHIFAHLNHKKIPIVIDTGANICCIKHDILQNDKIILNQTINLVGPDNQPLIVLGSTRIEITIENHAFHILTYIVKDLSSTLILGNNFLTKHNAYINYRDKNMTLNDNITTKLYFSNININNINEIHPKNINEITKNILEIPQEYAIAHCISADLKMNKGLAAEICKQYGSFSEIFSNLTINVGDAIPIIANNRLILYLITKQNYYQKHQFNDIQKAISNSIKELYKLKHYKLAIPKLATGLDKCSWSDIKQLLCSEFSNTNIELIICNYDNNNPNLTNNYNTHHIEKNVSNINDYTNDKNENEMEIKSNNEQTKTTFHDYKPVENVPSDGNCGIYAICNALNDNKTNNITTIADLLDLLNLSTFPNYWWSDDELASIANYYNRDTYIYIMTQTKRV